MPITFHFPLLVFICSLALLSPTDAGARIKDRTITTAKLIRELRREYSDFYEYHMLSMLVVHAIGDRFYNVTDEQISPECSTTAKVAVTMKLQLVLGKEMDSLMNGAVADSMKDFKNDQESKHPLEFVCKSLEKAIAEKPNLLAARQKALQNLMPGFTGGGRPPYSQDLLTKRAPVAMLMMKKLTVPDIARYICDEEVQNQLEESAAYSIRAHLFVKTLVAIGEKERFGQLVQSVYEKSLDEVVPRITANIRLDTLLMADQKTFWFLPEVLKIFYNNVAKDAVLKREVEDTAAVLGKDADPADLDFSRI